MYTFKVWRDPYDEGFNTTTAREITLNEGLTVLVGCNGAGKSTLIHNIRDDAHKKEIPFYHYDNLRDGGSKPFQMLLETGNINGLGSRLCSSEGENIALNIGDVAGKMYRFIKDAENLSDDPFSRLARSIFKGDEEEKEVGNQRLVLLDAVDSGYSIDNVIELKELFNTMIDDAKKLGIELYIIVSANEYELVDGSECIDAMTGKYITFRDYEDYKKFILKTRKKKEKRYERLNAKREKEKQNERIT